MKRVLILFLLIGLSLSAWAVEPAVNDSSVGKTINYNALTVTVKGSVGGPTNPLNVTIATSTSAPMQVSGTARLFDSVGNSLQAVQGGLITRDYYSYITPSSDGSGESVTVSAGNIAIVGLPTDVYEAITDSARAVDSFANTYMTNITNFADIRGNTFYVIAETNGTTITNFSDIRGNTFYVIADTKGTTVSNFADIRGNTFYVIAETNGTTITNFADIRGNTQLVKGTHRSKFLSTINTWHTEQEDGDTFRAGKYFADTDSQVFNFYVPNGVTAHVRLLINTADGSLTMNAYSGGNAAGGTTLTSKNFNQTSANTTGCKLYSNAIADVSGSLTSLQADTTLIGVATATGASGKVGSGASGNDEDSYILGAGSYIFITNALAATVLSKWLFEWYEE